MGSYGGCCDGESDSIDSSGRGRSEWLILIIMVIVGGENDGIVIVLAVESHNYY